MINSRGISQRYSVLRNYCQKYIGILVKSTRRAIDAMVAMYCSLGRLKILINAPLSTPHVPISPAENPESAHHNLPSRGLGFLNNTGVKNEYAANDARTIPKIIFNIS
jgi:hypothetical protein